MTARLRLNQVAADLPWLALGLAACCALAYWGTLAALAMLAAAVVFAGALVYLARPYWYLWLVLLAVLVFPYNPLTRELTVGGQEANGMTPWAFRLGPMPLADLLIISLFLRVVLGVVLEKRFRVFRFDTAVLVFVLAFLPAAVIGMLGRDALHTWRYWLFGIRPVFLLTATYLACSRFVKRDSLRGPASLVTLLLIGLAGATLLSIGQALTGSIAQRAGGAMLLVSQAPMFATVITIAVALLATPGVRPGVKVLVFLQAMLTVGALLIGTRRAALLLTPVAGLVTLLYLPRRRRGRAVLWALALLVAMLVVTFVGVSVSGQAGQLWLAFMTGGNGGQIEGVSDRILEFWNTTSNLTRYGGWVFGLGIGRRWERIHAVSYHSHQGENWFGLYHVPFERQLFECGLVGLGVVFLYMGMVFAYTWRVRGGNGASPTALLAYNLAAGCVGGFLVSMTQIGSLPNTAVFTGALLGALDALTSWVWPAASAPDQTRPPTEEACAPP